MGVGIEQYRCAIGSFHPVLKFVCVCIFFIIVCTHLIQFKNSWLCLTITLKAKSKTNQHSKSLVPTSVFNTDAHKTIGFLALLLLLLLLLASDVELNPGLIDLSPFKKFKSAQFNSNANQMNTVGKQAKPNSAMEQLIPSCHQQHQPPPPPLCFATRLSQNET